MSDTGKQRRSRIELGYYRTPDAMSRWRGRLTLVACLIAGAWALAAPTWDGRQVGGIRFLQQDRLASKGPVARPHAMWESKCEACHTPFTPINDSRWSPALGTAPHDGGGSVRCETCHAGPPHHASQRPEDVPSCAECHRDHRGRDASLLAMDDSACTSCHQNLADHRDKSAVAKVEAEHVTRFDADPAHHPAFTAPPVDSGRIRFSHARHMANGQRLDEHGEPFRFESLDESDRARYGWTPGRDRDAVQLHCETCHRLDGAEDGGRGRTAGDRAIARSSGALMLPVTYENDCRACHQLRFEPKDPKRQVRHGRQPRETIDELREFYTARAVMDDPRLLQRFIPPSPMPNRPISPESARAGEAALARTLIATRLFFGSAVEDNVLKRQNLPQGRRGCVECHEVTPAGRPLDSLEAARRLEIKPVVVRPLWFESARFDHSAHRAVECAACHKDVEKSKDQSVPLLPNIEQCVDCHAPSTTLGGKPAGGADVSCVECHRYHNGDHPSQGIGARARLGKAEMAVDQFLSGGPPRGR